MTARIFPAEETFLTPEQAAIILGISKQLLKNWRTAGRVKLQSYRLGYRTVRYLESDVMELKARLLREKDITERRA